MRPEWFSEFSRGDVEEGLLVSGAGHGASYCSKRLMERAWGRARVKR